MLKSINREKVLLILNWCISKFGKSKFWDSYPTIRTYKSKGFSEDSINGVRGTYCYGKIAIYLGSITTYEELCKTVIHEYKHYLMNHTEYLIIEKKLYRACANHDSVYSKHPHEKRAINAENKWGKICYNELKSELSKRI